MTGGAVLTFVFAGRRLLLVREGEEARPLLLEEAAELVELDRAGPVAFRHPDGRPMAVACIADDAPIPASLEPVGLRGLFGRVDPGLFHAAGVALQRLEWCRSHAYCGACGGATNRHPRHDAMACEACGTLHFPRVSPAVIVLVERDDQMLLARSPRFPEGVYSTLAGFVEPGESLEDTVHREIGEEVGVEVTDLRYFSSQPWPFPHSLMVGFTAQWASGDIRVDGVEIEDAGWFSARRLPPALPTSFSIARALIDDFLRRAGGPTQTR